MYLLDEPLSNLDALLRTSPRSINIRRQKSLSSTSPDQTEAMTLSKVAVLNNGYLQQLDPPERIYNHPASQFGWICWQSQMNLLTLPVRDVTRYW